MLGFTVPSWPSTPTPSMISFLNNHISGSAYRVFQFTPGRAGGHTWQGPDKGESASFRYQSRAMHTVLTCTCQAHEGSLRLGHQSVSHSK